MSTFDDDLAENVATIRAERNRLLTELRLLADADLQRTRRGGWSVREVLRHLIDAEVAYTKVLGFLRSAPIELGNANDEDLSSMAAAVMALERVRERLMTTLDGVDETTFYELRALGHDQYSVVSVLENVASHDHEHREQIAKTLAT